MNFDPGKGFGRRIAVIGAGISGMAVAHELAKDHRVVYLKLKTDLADMPARGWLVKRAISLSAQGLSFLTTPITRTLLRCSKNMMRL